MGSSDGDPFEKVELVLSEDYFRPLTTMRCYKSKVNPKHTSALIKLLTNGNNNTSNNKNYDDAEEGSDAGERNALVHLKRVRKNLQDGSIEALLFNEDNPDSSALYKKFFGDRTQQPPQPPSPGSSHPRSCS